MPFGPYKDFASCVRDNQDKSSPEAYCAQIHKDITGRWPSEKQSISSESFQYQEGFSMSMIKDFVKKIIDNPIKATIAAILIAQILKKHK